jgi:hypothetical protein
MALDPIHTDALRDTSIAITLPEWNTIRTTASIWNRDSESFDATYTLKVDGEPVDSQTVSVDPDEIRTAVDRWQRMQRVEVALEHTVSTTGEHTVEFGGQTQTVLTLRPMPDRFETWDGAGNAGNDGRYGLDADDHFVLLAGTDTDAWRGNNAFNTIYLPDGLEDGGTATVKVISQETTEPYYTKGGLIVRNDMDTPAGEPGGKGMVRAAVSPPDTINRPDFDGDGDTTYESGRFAMAWDQNGDGTAMAEGGFPPKYYSMTTAEPVWLRLEKSGTSYTGYYSIDGTNFTEMTTVDVSQAASTQDVGMWGVSLAGERCRHEFGDFTVTNP